MEAQAREVKGEEEDGRRRKCNEASHQQNSLAPTLSNTQHTEERPKII
jgi:hypothetical protein